MPCTSAEAQLPTPTMATRTGVVMMPQASTSKRFPEILFRNDIFEKMTFVVLARSPHSARATDFEKIAFVVLARSPHSARATDFEKIAFVVLARSPHSARCARQAVL